MNHYVYRLDDPTGFFYFGSRSTRKNPDGDGYMGGGSWPTRCRKSGVLLVKTVLSVHANRIDASTEEIRLINHYWGHERLQNIARAVQDPKVGIARVIRENPLKTLVYSPIWRLPSLARIIWIEMVGRNCEIGMSVPVLARRTGFSESECEEALCMIQETKDENLPRFFKTGNIWKTSNQLLPCM